MNPHDSSQEPDDFIIYPTDTLFGIIDDAADAERSLRALIAAGFTRDSVRIFCGETGAERIDASGVHYGLPAQLVRLFQMTTGERTHADRYEQAAREGRHVFGVHVAVADAREEVRQILKAHGGHFINFYGRRTFSKLDL